MTGPSANSAAAADRPTVATLRSRASVGSAWSLGGYAFGQALRLVANLVLTRLLFPEAFGLMTLVNVFVQGLQMFSDLGLGASVVQDRRGDDPAFVDTAWTVQVVRGVVLWLLASVIAWPLSRFYGEPALLSLLPAAGAGALIAGFASANSHRLVRQLHLKRLVLLNTGSQAGAVAITVLCAWIWPSVWALVIGALSGNVIKTLASHVLLPGRRSRFHFERDAALSMLRFGRWIVVSTALTFLASEGDRLLMGKLLSMAELGVYNIAFFLAAAVPMAIGSLSGSTLFPLYARLADHDPAVLRSEARRLQRILLAGTLPLMCGLVVFGPKLVELLYDPRYHGAGTMLQILAAGGIVRCLSLTISPVLLARGDSFSHMTVLATRSVALLLGIPIGWSVAGATGVVTAVAATHAINYPILVWRVRHHGTWHPDVDMQALLGVLGLIALLSWLA